MHYNCRTMRILQVLPHLSKGGAERVVVELSNSLIEFKDEVTVLLSYPVDRNLNQRFLHEKINTVFVSKKFRNRFLQYLILPFWILRHRRDLGKYDVIHCHLTFGFVFGFYAKCLRIWNSNLGFKLIATNHAVGTGTSGLAKLMSKRFSHFFDFFVLMAVDPEWRKFISKNRRDNISVISNGIFSESLNSFPTHRHERDFFSIGTISRLEAERKPWLFLETFSYLYDLMGDKVRFSIGGDGSEKENMQARAQELGIGSVLSMPGMVLDSDVFIQNLDAYLTLNVEETTGIAGLEAILCGIPVVAIQLVQNYESNFTDWIWSSQSPKIVAIQIAHLLNNPTELQTTAARQQKIATDEYSIAKMRGKYRHLYSQ
jgi:glycosyltransferase involved in cell wall biosynthesis